MPSRNHRRRWRTLIEAGLLASSASVAVAQIPTARDPDQLSRIAVRYAELNPTTIAKQIKFTDDDLDAVATFSTENAFRYKGGFTDRIRADNFLRALISKSDGVVTYQVYQTLLYGGGSREFSSVNTSTSGDIITLPLTINRERIDCPYNVCIRYVDLAFDVPEALLQEVANRARSQTPQPWRFRFKSRAGADWTDDIAPAEVAGLIAAVERYKRERSRP